MDYNKFFADIAEEIVREDLAKQAAAEAEAKKVVEAAQEEKNKFLTQEFVAELLVGFDELKKLPGSKVTGELRFSKEEGDLDGYYADLETNIYLNRAFSPHNVTINFDRDSAYIPDCSFGFSGRLDYDKFKRRHAQAFVKQLFQFAVADGKINLQDVLGGGKPKPAVIPQGDTPASLM